MSSLALALLSYILIYKYALLFGLFFVSTAIIIPFPDNTVLLAAGAFSVQGYFSFWLSLASIIAGCMCGDLFDFFLARRYGLSVSKRIRFKIPPFVDTVERYVRRHPGLSIFCTRFVGTFDVLVNLLSGFIGVPILTFLLFDFLGNFVSNILVLAVGYAMGDYWMSVLGIVETIGWILLSLVVIAALVVASGQGYQIPRAFRAFRRLSIRTLKRLTGTE